MKRLPRNPEKFDTVELFTAMSREHDYELQSTKDQADFLSKIGASIKSAADDQRLLHGKRVEGLFQHVAGALGGCLMIKPEDSGAMVAAGLNIRAPDYSVVLKSGLRLLIEVKSCFLVDCKSNYEFTRDYLEGLENYARLQGADLKFAIYYSQWNKWVLLSKQAFVEHKRKFTINFLHAMAKNEMATLGDRSIGTTPSLAIELVASQDNDSSISSDGIAKFVIGGIRAFCAGEEVTNSKDIQLVFQFVRFGRWVEAENKAVLDGDKVKSLRFEYRPHENEWDKEAGFAIVGDLSSLVSSAYNEHTVYERKVIALDSKYDPEFFKVDIADGYSGENLPLWQIQFEPNFDFKP
ncbi:MULTISPECIES: hypothetical protein [unclassified Pseudomonas]|uniref:hypothetical protein n=1 Tax=unclassified Pseudomonas TaxID=196821 RepID=UPI001179F1C2|nr:MULTISPECIES: hypothetical protein [unclassified Pseudomonas]